MSHQRAISQHLKGRSRSLLLASLLAGSWRQDPAPSGISAPQLEVLTPLLLGSGAAGLAWARIRDTNSRAVPAAVELQQAYRMQVLRAALHERQLQRLFRVLHEASLDPVLIKGWCIAQCYAEPRLRPHGDIDICCEPSDYPLAVSVLGLPRPTGEVVSFGSEGVLVEIHRGYTDLSRTRDLPSAALLARSRRVPVGDTTVRVLCPEDHLRLICVHFLRHGAWRPLWLCDIGAAVEARTRHFDWDRCLGTDPVRADWVACAIGVAHQLLGVEVAATPVAQRAGNLPRWLVPAVLQAWETPCSAAHQTPTPFLRHVRPTQLPQIARARWFNPIEATVLMGRPFNQWPRLPWQLGMYLIRFGKFFRGGLQR